MAQSGREVPEIIQQFTDVAMALIQEAVRYASEGVWDENADANIRHVRAVVAILHSAVNAAAVPRPSPPPPSGDD